MLANWDFKDDAANSTTQQINRQKSARNLEILQFDPSGPRAVFFDPKRNNEQTATLSRCDCNDFNLSGSSQRKTFKPCMHIYRLAIELGLIEAKYLDSRLRSVPAGVSSPEEILRFQQLPRDKSQWGSWACQIHTCGDQRNRQHRAYSIIHDEQDAIREIDGGWIIHGYSVTLQTCECVDFVDRRLPCKHIYAAALASKIILPFTYADYQAVKNSAG